MPPSIVCITLNHKFPEFIFADFMSDTVDLPTPNSFAISTAFSPFFDLSKILNFVGILSTTRFLFCPFEAIILCKLYKCINANEYAMVLAHIYSQISWLIVIEDSLLMLFKSPVLDVNWTALGATPGD